MALYRTDAYWSDSSLILPSLRTLSSNDTLGTLLNLSNPIILTSTSLDHLSFTDPAPSLPPGHRPPLFTLMDLREEGRRSFEDIPRTAPCTEERIVVSTPTLPRMRVLPEEKIVVDNWTVKVRPQTPPDHVPWGDTGSAGRFSEGHLTSPASDHAGIPNDRAQGLQQSSESPCPRTPRFNALAFNRPVTHACRETKKPQKDSTVQPQGVPAPIKYQAGEMASSRHETTAFQQVSFYPITHKRHQNLAVRRGHKAFSSLKLDQATIATKRREIASFDSIPTAFRGSPTAYCSPFQPLAQYPAPQNLALAEMLESLREKCASFSPQVSLPVDWFYRPRAQVKDITKLSGTASSDSRNDEDEWAFAESLMDMINSFSAEVDDLSAHSIVLEDDILDLPILSRASCDNTNPETYPSLVEGDQSERLSKSARLLPARPSIINPTPSPAAYRSGTRKTVRFADAPTFFPLKDKPTVAKEERTSGSPRRLKRHSVVLSAWIPPNPPLSVVRSLQSINPSQISLSDTSRSHSLGSPPPPRRPLSHRYPTTPKLPSFMDGNSISRTLSGSPLRQSSMHQQPSDIVGKPPSTRAQSSKKRSLTMRGKKSRVTKENLKISQPIPITAIPRPRPRTSDKCGDSNSSKSHVTSPLRSIFMKFR